MQHLEEAADDSLKVALDAVRVAGVRPRIRVSITLWNGDQYVAWRGQSWKVDVDDEQGAKQFKEALEAFFDAVAAEGTQATWVRLQR